MNWLAFERKKKNTARIEETAGERNDAQKIPKDTSVAALIAVTRQQRIKLKSREVSPRMSIAPVVS